MYALHLAVSAIRNGDCDGAIVAAANWITDPSLQIVLDKLGALSPTSRCHTFDASADGYARGEGFVAIYLKRSSIAVFNGLPIRALVRGTAINANGKTGGITRPSARGQEDVIRKAYENAGNLAFSDTTFFECHGTGTQAGDPLEVSAIGNVFASSRSDAPEDRLLIGSIKPTLGHTEGASALASIMKVVLALEAGEIPPTFGVEKLNPNIDFEGAKVMVVKDGTVSWPEGKLRRASVNSFGFGGANGHCIIDHVNNVYPDYIKPGITISRLAHAAQRQPNNSNLNGYSDEHFDNGGRSSGGENLKSNGVSTPTPPSTPRGLPVAVATRKIASAQASTHQLVLLPFSAHNASSLWSNIDALRPVIGKWSLADIAYTLSCRRSRLQQRTFCIVDRDNPTYGLSAEKRIFTSRVQTSNVAYVFTGQGAQWHAMGAELFKYGVFQDTITYLDNVLKELPEPPSWSISATLSGTYEAEQIQLPKVSQVACTAVQLAIVDLLYSWSVRPVAVVGHSSGEMAAAYASGHITAAEAIMAAYFRGQAVSKNKRKGAMLAVGMDANQVSGYLQGNENQIKIAAINSPGSVTLSGDVDAVEALSASLTQDNVFNRVLRTSGSAYHSHHMLAVSGDFIDMLYGGTERLKNLGLVDETLRYPITPWVSSVELDQVMSGREITADYWRSNLESPVRFSQAITKMMSMEDSTTIDVLVEIGPHAALKGPLEQILKGTSKPAQYVPSLQRNEDSQKSLLQLAGMLFTNNAEIDLAAVNSVDSITIEGQRILTHGCTAVDLPAYQYTYGAASYYEGRISKEYRLREALRHDLLGSKVPGASKLQPQWRNFLRVKDLPWLSDHRLLPDVVFPAAGFIALGVEAAARVYRALQDPLKITGYSFRKVDINTALRIPEDDYGIEIIISMELVDTATAKSPAWARFAVASVTRESNEWTQHCSGLVKVEVSLPAEPDKLGEEMDPRFPRSQAWYDKFAEIGLGYGETFQSLSEIQVDPYRNLGKATIALNKTSGTIKGGESDYPLHPTALDATFQLAIIAFYGGRVEKANAAFVPVHLSQLYLKARDRHRKLGKAIARGSIKGLRSAYAQLQMVDQDGDIFLEVDSMRFTRYNESKETKEMQSKRHFSSPFSRLVWKPDIRTLNNRQIGELFPPPTQNFEGAATLEIVDMICCLVVFDIYKTFVLEGETPSPKGEIRHWLDWIRRIVEEDQRPNVIEARKLSPDERQQLLLRLCVEAGDIPEAKAAKLLHENAGAMLNEQRTGIDVLVSNKLLTPLYEIGHVIAGSHPQLFNIMDCLGHANPNLRILEIGAGTGAATRVAMKALVGPNGIKRYADYTFTDISAGLLASAKEMLSDYRDVNYSVLDIERDPLEIGYEPVYDVVLACEAIHATANMDQTLKHCRSLLKPGGKLVLVETTRMRVLLGLLFGTLTGYWQSDNRTEGPFMDLQTWQRRLPENGFSGTDLVLDDYHAPHSTTSVLVATRIEEQNAKSQTQLDRERATPVYLLHDIYGAPPLCGQIASEFKRRDVTCKALPLDNTEKLVPTNSRVIVFLSSENDLLDADARRLQLFQYLAQNIRSMIWLTTGGMVKGQNPRGAFMAGLLRVIATENPAGRFLSINIEGDNFELGKDDLVCSIVDKELAIQTEGHSGESVDGEFAWQDGCMRVSRVVPDVGLSEYSETIKTPSHQGFQMLPIDGYGPICAAFETPGIPSSLYFRKYAELLQPLPEDHIDIKVAATGLNWKDVALTTGRDKTGSNNFSSEYAGIVTKVGAKVIGLCVGDRVYGMGRGRFGNYERVPAAFAQKIQPSDDFIEAATMPLVYMTAVYAFEHVTRLRLGQKVLIQSATGGLGLAAIQVARSRGAEIFVTVGTSEKASFLANTIGIPMDHIFSSRDAEALYRTTKSMKKGGFDVILSTVVGGDLLYQSLEALAPMGHLIDVGRVDVLDSKEMGLDLFQKNANFSSFDLNVVLDNDPELGRQLMETVDELRRAGQIMPVRPVSVSHISDLSQTLHSFSRGKHIGKLVVSFDNSSPVKLLQQPQIATFDRNARYIVTGGLGGLGRSIVRWMVDRGAQDLLILSRRQTRKMAVQMLFDDLRARGVCIEIVSCDVIRKEQVLQAIHKASAADRPIKGVVHAAASWSDLSFDKLTVNQWRSGIDAKIRGSINLHEATIALPLDFFVMLTSTETIWAPPTQAAYIAADNFVTYFARYRRQLGLVASTVSYGFVSDIGSDFRETSHGTEDMYTRNQASTITEHQALNALEPAFLNLQGTSPWIGQQQDPLSAATLFTCLNPVDLANLTATNEPYWHRDGRVSLLVRAMKDARRHTLSKAEDGIDGEAENSASGTAVLRRAFDDAVKIGPGARASTVDLVTDGIIKTVAEMLFIDAGSVNPSKSVAEHGVDSLIAAELRNWLYQALGTKLQNILDSDTSIEQLAQQIVDKALET
ncbi:MAG: Type I Iterative PKS [Bogoriella megaspora]|nr:MAG: Type I Iterative PKS [Bogoriella megaspora]